MSHDEGNTSVEPVSTEVSLENAQAETQNPTIQVEETPTDSAQEVSTQPLSQDIINQLIQIGKEKADWSLLGEAILKDKIAVIPKEMLTQIQERFLDYEKHMGDYKLVLGAQRLLVNVLYPAMKNPQLIKQYLKHDEGRISLDISRIGKELLGVELSLHPAHLLKSARQVIKLFKNGDALKETYNQSEIKPVIDKLHTTKHLKTVPASMAIDYLGICYRQNVIPEIAFEALEKLGLLNEEQVAAIIAELTNENKEDGEDKE